MTDRDYLCVVLIGKLSPAFQNVVVTSSFGSDSSGMLRSFDLQIVADVAKDRTEVLISP